MDTEALVRELTAKVIRELNLVRRFIPVGVSVRHVHLCQADLETLFGPGYTLHKLRDLSQPGEFAARETVTVVGPKLQAISRVRVLGPLRSRTQVELAQTDGVVLGLNLPVRKSGDLAGSAPITLVGPAGAVYLREGAIRANRHIHMDATTAALLGIKDNDEVQVRVRGEKPTVFGAVQVRVSEKFITEMHIDTDDANAAGLVCGDMVELVLDGKGG